MTLTSQPPGSGINLYYSGAVDCKNGKTHAIKARVLNSGQGVATFEITTMGYTGGNALVGQADVAHSFGSVIPGEVALLQPGTKKGSTSALVLVSVWAYISAPFNYQVEFFCYDVNGGELGNPIVKLLQDQ